MSTGQVYNEALQYFSDIKDEKWYAIRPFLVAGFDISWAKQINLHGSDLLYCFLKPNDALKEAYGFKYEIVLVFHLYSVLDARTFKAIATFMTQGHAKGRVDSMFYFLVSKAKNCEREAMSYLIEHKEERIAITIPLRDLVAPELDEWVVRNALQKHYLTLDRFKNTLPLQEDTYFFGRQRELGFLLDSAKQVENSGLFGLRKTGKTSLLFKLQRAIERDTDRKTYYIDAQSTSIRLRSWHDLLQYICKGLFKKITRKLNANFLPADAADDFAESIDEYLEATKGLSLTLIIDEVEWISPGTALDTHWNNEFSSFWHTIRTYQTQTRKLNVVISGVNPSMVEQDSFNGFQNPLFGIVNTTYLTGLTGAETEEMTQNIGRLMGLKFEPIASQYLYSKYAGHPMLTRLACSYSAEIEKAKQTAFPVLIDEAFLKSTSTARDRELRFYCGHIVSELAKFYPEEYKLLELLSTGREAEFRELIRYNSAAIHLHKYGIVTNGAIPQITYEVLNDYVAEENARREGRATKFYTIPLGERDVFAQQRIRSIVEDMRTLETSAREAGHPSLFGLNSFPEADKLLNINPPCDEKTLSSALTPLYRSFVESVDNYGTENKIKNYFWGIIKTYYPLLQDALLRIRLYRHQAQHLELKPNVQEQLNHFLSKDLEGDVTHKPERYWIQFQRVLDELHRALQIEISTIRA
jgi:hypothetical protein